MQAYCIRCKQKQDMLAATRTLMKNGARAMTGTCACCATPLYIAGLWDSEPAPSPAPPSAAPAPLHPAAPPK